jgi:hypothetical protein
MKNEVVDSLECWNSDKIFVDCTLGGGGHSEEILKRISPQGRLISFDVDDDAIEHATNRLKNYKNITIVKGTCNDIIAIRESGGIPNIRVVADMYKNGSYYWSTIGNYQGYAAYYYGDLYVSTFIFDSYYGGGPRYVVVTIGSDNTVSNIYFNDL